MWRRCLEVEEIEHGEALERAPSRDRIVAGLISTGTARAFSDVQSAAETCAIKLIRQLDALDR